MINNTHQIMSPEMRPEDARFWLVQYSVSQIKAMILLAHPELKTQIVGRQIVLEQSRVPEIIDYTVEQSASVIHELVSSDVKLEGFEQYKRIDEANEAVADAYKDQYGLAA